MTEPFLRLVLAGVGAAFFGAVGANAADGPLGVEDPKAYLIDRDEEIALSRSAALPSVSDKATILVLTESGDHEVAVEGENDWTCFTGRSWTGPSQSENGRRQWSKRNFDPVIRAPQCFNKLGAQTVLQKHLLMTKMLMTGASPAEVDLEIALAVQSGAMKAPSPGAMSYMQSPKQIIGPRSDRFMPHLMLFTPFLTQDAYGDRDKEFRTPIVTTPGSVWTTTVVISPFWSDGEPAFPNQ